MLDRQCVLIVEDYPDSAQILRLFLASKGIASRVCPNGYAALKALTPDTGAIILDVGLPGMSGVQLAQSIRMRPDGDRYVIIGYSGYGTAENREAALRAGMDGYFLKPTDPNTLLTEIERQLALRSKIAKATARVEESVRRN